MKHSSRLFSCSFCLQQVVICSHCDRGNIYCSPKCAINARKQYCKESNKRYQQTTKGKFNNALRQKRFRARQKNCQSAPQWDLFNRTLMGPLKQHINGTTRFAP